MIDFSKIQAPISIDTDFILSKLDDTQIFYYYFGPFELGKIYPSKFRKDRKPSTGFFIHRRTKAILYNDLTTGEKLNCFQFVAKLFGCSFPEALNQIARDFGLIEGSKSTPLAQKIISQPLEFDREEKEQTLIQFIPKKFTSLQKEYWAKRFITEEELIREDIYTPASLFINKREVKFDELTFIYTANEKVGKEWVTYLKVYQPYGKDWKWKNNIPLNVPFGIKQLKYGTDRIVISKAQKERLILLKFFPSVIATQNESESSLTPKLVKHLCFNFPYRTIMWDADKTGVENCKKFNAKGFDYFNTPNHLLEIGIKDIDEFVVNFGLNALEKLFKEKKLI